MIHDLLVVAAVVAAVLSLILALLSKSTIRVSKATYVLACVMVILVVTRPTSTTVRYGPPAPQRFTCSNHHVPIVWLDGHTRNIDCSLPIVPARGVRP